MSMNRYLKISLTAIVFALWLVSLKLWLAPQEVLAKDFDIENRLSYISKAVGAIESSVIKIEGDLRFVKRQVGFAKTTKDFSDNRLINLETKITNIAGLVDSIEMDVSELDGNIAYIENDIERLTSGSCDNLFLCRQKKN